LADKFDYPSRPLSEITWPLYIEGGSYRLDRRVGKLDSGEADEQLAGKLKRATQKLEDALLEIRRQEETISSLKDSVQKGPQM